MTHMMPIVNSHDKIKKYRSDVCVCVCVCV